MRLNHFWFVGRESRIPATPVLNSVSHGRLKQQLQRRVRWQGSERHQNAELKHELAEVKRIRNQLTERKNQTQIPCAGIAGAFNSQLSTAHAQGTAFTYQGRLNDGANPANGKYDLTFALFSVSNGVGQVGSPLTNVATAVSNGLFTVTLDFGNQFPGANSWLEIAVRTNGGGSFFTLSPRQALTPAPYAITAGSVVSCGLNPAPLAMRSRSITMPILLAAHSTATARM